MAAPPSLPPTGTVQLAVDLTCFFSDHPFRRSAAYTHLAFAARIPGLLRLSRSCPRASEVRSPSPSGSPIPDRRRGAGILIDAAELVHPDTRTDPPEQPVTWVRPYR